MQSRIVFALCLVIYALTWQSEARIHKLELRNDNRRYIALTTFGFYTGGVLSVNLTNFRTDDENGLYGFSLDRTLTDLVIPSMTAHQDKCFLKDFTLPKPHNSIIFLTMDFKNRKLLVNCSKDLSSMHIYQNKNMIATYRPKRDSLSGRLSDTALFPRKKRRATSLDPNAPAQIHDSTSPVAAYAGCSGLKLPMDVKEVNGQRYWNTTFAMQIVNSGEEGRYNLYFHNCKNYESDTPTLLDFMMQIEEDNKGNFLSASEIPLPRFYFITATLFFLSGCFWVFILQKSKHPVFKIHYLMAVLVFLKSLSLLFHGINFHFIQTKGEHVAAWAILYYITHLLKGGVLFITIVLIGTGWTFIKYILADKDKKVFMIVIPFQVLANVAEIIIQESEEGDVEYEAWRIIFIIVDLLCCGAIMFPVVWSIRHLEEASDTDGKAAINLRKLKLFRHFYIMILCYIYFTRIIVYLLKITVPFQYECLDEMFRESATYIFFVLTGYKFRPASANPYFSTTNDDLVNVGDDEDDEVDEVVSRRSGVSDGLSKVGKALKSARATPCDVIASHEEKDRLLNQMESSHEYD